MLVRVAVAIDDNSLGCVIKRALESEMAYVRIFNNLGLLKIVEKDIFDLVVLSSSRMKGVSPELLEVVKQMPDCPEIVIIDDRLTEQEQAAFYAAGCSRILKPDISDKLIIDTLFALLSSKSEPAILDTPQLESFTSNSAVMNEFLRVVKKVSRSNSSILILGETGVGKEHLARAIHSDGPRSQQQFVAVHCAALPDSLLESELFGHEKGAFTGAIKTRRGAFELAHQGTIFLDEIGDMPLHLQVKLLRVLQDREFKKLGGEKDIKVDVRILAATNKNLSEEVEKGTFRRDLYYRLGVISLKIPSLSERSEDIYDLAYKLIAERKASSESKDIAVTNQAMKALINYSWPGNIRELINVLERALLLADSEIITVKELPDELVSAMCNVTSQKGNSLLDNNNTPEHLLKYSLKDLKASLVEELEKKYLTACLTKYKGRIKDVATHSGMTTRAVYNKMSNFDLDKSDFK